MNFKAGSTIRCTVNTVPMAKGPYETLERLMRRDPSAAKALRRSQETRRQTTTTKGRGGRVWVQRQRCGKIVKVRAGQTWSMTFTFDIAPDLKSVESYLSISA